MPYYFGDGLNVDGFQKPVGAFKVVLMHGLFLAALACRKETPKGVLVLGLGLGGHGGGGVGRGEFMGVFEGSVI